MSTNNSTSKPKVNKFEKDFYSENGFVIMKNIFPAQQIIALNQEYDDLFNNKIGIEDGNFFDLGGDKAENTFKMPQLLNPSKYSQIIAKSGIHEICRSIAKELMEINNENLIITRDHAIMKPAINSVDTPWHQDEAYLNNRFDHNNCSFWVPLHNVDFNSGCMCFIPKSHNLGIIEHRHINNNKKIHGLEALNVEVENMQICPLKIGSATVHNCKTLHYAPANKSGLPRKALIIVCTGPKIKLSFPRNFHWQNNE